MTPQERRAKIGAVVRVASGNFLEMYDFIVFGYYAKEIARTFFPSGSEFASLMLTLVTFGAGYLMRPLGAVVLGGYIDRVGRRRGLIVTLALMAVGTLTIAATPGYATIGPVAPVIVVIGRLLQGLSAGVELGGVSVYLAEIATPGRRGFYTSWQSASQQLAVVFTAVLGVGLNAVLGADQMADYGWRIPLLVGCAIIPLIWMFRRSLAETEEFLKKTHRPSGREVARVLATNWHVILLGMMLTVMTTTSFYLITAYTPTFGRQALKLDAETVMLVTMFIGISNFFWLPIGGALSDRFGRLPQLLLMPALAILTATLAMNWMVAAPSFGRLLEVELWLSLLYGLYNGAMVPILTEIMPPEVRTAGFSLAYSLATALFGGFTPAVCTYLIQATGNPAAPAMWLSVAAAIALVAAVLVKRGAAMVAQST